MAKIQEDAVVIKLSKLVRDDEEATAIATEDTLQQLEVILTELVGAGVLVEVYKG